jgi:hypothetical protein
LLFHDDVLGNFLRSPVDWLENGGLEWGADYLSELREKSSKCTPALSLCSKFDAKVGRRITRLVDWQAKAVVRCRAELRLLVE